MLKNKFRERLAASSLLLVLILPPFFLALLYAFQSTAMRLAELDYLRAQKAAGDYARVHFDRKLWQEFRLWAGREVLDLESIVRILPSKPDTDIKIFGAQNALEPEDLKKQILKQIQERLPLLLTAEMTDRLRLLKSSQAELGAASLEIASELEAAEVQEIENLPRLSAEGDEGEDPEELDELAQDSEMSGRDESEISAVGSKLLRRLQRNLDKHKEQLLSTYHAEDLAEIPVDSLQHLEGLGRLATSYATAMDNLDLAKVAVIEYVLNYCPAEVVVRRQGASTLPIRRLDGRAHERMKENYGGALVESILTGLPPERAAKRVQLYLLGLRLASHDASINASAAKRSKYKIYGSILSAAVALFTAGSVVLPPEVYTQTLIFGRAAQLAHRDVRALKSGEGVPIWPDERVPAQAYYHDFLRLFFYARAEEKILLGLRDELQKLYPEALYATYRIESHFADRHHQFQVSYGDEVRDER